MDNPFNKLITKKKVEEILNKFGNIGDDDSFLQINNLEYYQLAFVHESYYMSTVKNVLNNSNQFKNEKTQFIEFENIFLNYVPRCSNERLEYLGDHALKFTMSKYLYNRFGEEREGFLTRLKIKIERCTSLHQMAIQLGFKPFLLLSLQVENETLLDVDRGRNTPSIYEDSFEAFIGAIIEDFGEKGIIYADRFIINVIENIIDFSDLISTNDNFKDSIQRFFQSRVSGGEIVVKWKNPVYISVYEFTSLYNQKIFIKGLFLSEFQLLQLNETVINKVKDYTISIVKYYKHNYPIIFEKIMHEITKNNETGYILGMGQAKKVTVAEQECAKVGLLNLELDLDY
jgi:dsRNA-specific ribonuclease